jgi:hypothetical protein
MGVKFGETGVERSSGFALAGGTSSHVTAQHQSFWPLSTSGRIVTGAAIHRQHASVGH